MHKKSIQIKDIVYYSNISDSNSLKKFAEATKIEPDILKAAEEAYKKRENKNNVVAVVLAVTAWEWYGPNDNGDAFFENPMDGILDSQYTLASCYNTFSEKGKVYRYHQSKDEENAIGKIHYSYYNNEQHRVELVIEVYWDSAPSECLKLKRGVSLNVSMGCGVIKDYCSYCMNPAETAEEHCEHIKYQLLEVIDGIPVFMINVKPTFFDLSIVVIPGDPNAKVMYSLS